MDRRTALTSLATIATTPLLYSDRLAAAGEGAPPPPTTTIGVPTVKPLPFDPRRLRGLSERLIVSHHDNNYAGAVRNLQKAREQLAACTKDTPAFVVGGLRERELQFSGSMVMHELYFAHLGGDGAAHGALVKALPADWEVQLRSTAMSLSGGSGWATVSLSLHTGELSIGWAGNHTQAAAASVPLVVIDMYEHAYALDYGASAKDYVDAVFANLAWAVIDDRYRRARKAREALAA